MRWSMTNFFLTLHLSLTALKSWWSRQWLRTVTRMRNRRSSSGSRKAAYHPSRVKKSTPQSCCRITSHDRRFASTSRIASEVQTWGVFVDRLQQMAVCVHSRHSRVMHGAPFIINHTRQTGDLAATNHNYTALCDKPTTALTNPFLIGNGRLRKTGNTTREPGFLISGGGGARTFARCC